MVRPPPLVALCDISGSMARYAQILLHFLHAVTNDRDRVHSFLFGTRLTNVTRQLRHRDPEVAFELVVARRPRLVRRHAHRRVAGRCSTATGRRRVLGQGAVVLLITDGLDREGARGLAEATDAAAALLPAAGLAQSPVALRGLPAQISRASGRCCRTWTSSAPVHNLNSLRDLVADARAHDRTGRALAA